VGFTVSTASDPPRLTIIDEGDGLPSTDVFDRGSSSGSSGLGLDIVRRVAEESGGAVTLGDSPGTTIVVRFGEPVSPTKAR
jgi:signal transduction histidine kinase